MKNKYIVTLLLLFAIPTVKAQVLWTENFDNYPIGHLINDYTSTTPQQGGWYAGTTKPIANIKVTPETGKGNVIIVEKVGSGNAETINFQQLPGHAKTLWNSRNQGNNVLKFEYEFFVSGYCNAAGGIGSQGSTLINVNFTSQNNLIIGNYWENLSYKSILHNNSLLYNTWIKAEMFIDYISKNVYFYISLPTQNLQTVRYFFHNRAPEDIYFSVTIDHSGIVKFDNIKLTALQSLPTYLLSTEQQLATKFNLYPNPATNIVNITNAENMQVNQVSVYDISGKQLSTQTYNNEVEIQLNVEHLASGTYMLHLQTNEGLAVKKLVKK